MTRVALSDIVPLVVYEAQRADRRRRIIDLKRVRRVALGDALSIVFENTDTVLYQIQEMLRAERITDPVKVQEEIDTYNVLLPDRDELAGTLFIELTDPDTLERDLDRFIGLDRDSLFLRVGDAPPVAATFEAGHATDARIAAVHFIRFSLPPDIAARIRTSSDDVLLEVRHPACRVVQRLGDTVRESIRRDLTADP